MLCPDTQRGLTLDWCLFLYIHGILISSFLSSWHPRSGRLWSKTFQVGVFLLCDIHQQPMATIFVVSCWWLIPLLAGFVRWIALTQSAKDKACWWGHRSGQASVLSIRVWWHIGDYVYPLGQWLSVETDSISTSIQVEYQIIGSQSLSTDWMACNLGCLRRYSVQAQHKASGKVLIGVGNFLPAKG